MNRRTFLKWLGVGAVTAAVKPQSLLEGLEKPDVIDTPIVSNIYSDKSYDGGVTWWDESGTKVYKA